MALESLAPDQRAVVQLVLQQGRSYADLAGLLGISEDAVRQRARAGLRVLGADESVPADDQGQIADYLLGQQDEGERTATRELLQTSPAALDWAQFVSEDLGPIARHGLPDLPTARATADAEPEPVEAPAEPEPAPLAAPEPEGAVQDPEPKAEPEPVAAEPEPVAPHATRRERQRPRREREAATPQPRRRDRQRPSRERTSEGAAEAEPAAASGARESSRLGGALLLAAVALLVVVGVIYLFNRGDSEPKAANTTSTEASAGASATATPQAIAQLPLRAADGSEAEGLVQINATQQGEVGFTLAANNMETTKSGESAYAIWLVGKGKPALRLGFGEVLANQGETLAVQGPEPKVPQQTFTQGLSTYSQLIVSRETDGNVKEPSKAILRGSLTELRRGQGGQGGQGGSGGN